MNSTIVALDNIPECVHFHIVTDHKTVLHLPMYCLSIMFLHCGIGLHHLLLIMQR